MQNPPSTIARANLDHVCVRDTKDLQEPSFLETFCLRTAAKLLDLSHRLHWSGCGMFGDRNMWKDKKRTRFSLSSLLKLVLEGARTHTEMVAPVSTAQSRVWKRGRNTATCSTQIPNGLFSINRKPEMDLLTFEQCDILFVFTF